MPWVETGDPLDPWLWVRPEPVTESLPVVPTLDFRYGPAAEPDLPATEPGEIVPPEPIIPSLTSGYDSWIVPTPTQETPVKLSREPALLYVGLLAPVVQAISAFALDVSPGVQGAVNVLAVAIAGAITAALVRADNLVPAITAAFQAAVALVLAFGVDWSSDQQASLMIALGAITAVVVRDRVIAPVPATVDVAA